MNEQQILWRLGDWRRSTGLPVVDVAPEPASVGVARSLKPSAGWTLLALIQPESQQD